jgi:DNA-binding cell septation regulator SpoVG
MKKINLSEIQIIPIKPRNGLVSFASCIYNNQLALNSIAIYTKPDGSGYRLVYPAKTLPNGKVLNIFYPINKDTGKAIQEAIIAKYDELISKITDS